MMAAGSPTKQPHGHRSTEGSKYDKYELGSTETFPKTPRDSGWVRCHHAITNGARHKE